MAKFNPVAVVEVVKVCVASVLPFNEVIPPAPVASVPHEKVPLDQRSFSVVVLHADRDAP